MSKNGCNCMYLRHSIVSGRTCTSRKAFIAFRTICRPLASSENKHHHFSKERRRSMSGRHRDNGSRGGRGNRGGGRGRGYISPGMRPVEEDMRINIEESIESFQRSDATGENLSSIIPFKFCEERCEHLDFTSHETLIICHCHGYLHLSALALCCRVYFP